MTWSMAKCMVTVKSGKINSSHGHKLQTGFIQTYSKPPSRSVLHDILNAGSRGPAR